MAWIWAEVGKYVVGVLEGWRAGGSVVLWQCEAPHSLETPESRVWQLGASGLAPGLLAGVFPVPKEPRSSYHTLMAQRSLIVPES